MCWTQIKNIGHSLKKLGPFRKLFARPGVPSWLRGCSQHPLGYCRTAGLTGRKYRFSILR